MAKIPTGNFGNNVAQGSSAARLTPGAYDTSSGLVEAGQRLMRFAGQELANQRADQLQINQERDQLINDVVAQDSKVQKELKTLKLADKLKTRKDEITAVSDSLENQVKMGQLNYADVNTAFDKAMQKLNPIDLKGYDEVDTQLVNNGVKDYIRNAQIKLGSVKANGAVAEHRAYVDSFADSYDSEAGTPNADMTKLIARVDDLDKFGITAYGAGWDERKRELKYGMWYSNLNQQVMAASSNLNTVRELKKEITIGQYADKLKSANRSTLVSKLDGLETSIIQRQEAAAQRIQREQDRRLNIAEASFNAFQALGDKGGILSQETIDKTLQETEGTVYQGAVKAVIAQSKETGGLASQPIAVQKQLLAESDTEIASKGRSFELDKRREQRSKVLSSSIADLKNDGIRAGLPRGVITSLEPLDLSGPKALMISISKRIHSAEVMSEWAKGIVPSVSPLDNDEVESVRTMMDALPVKERSQFIANIVSVTGSRFGQAIAMQLDSKDRVMGLAFAAGTSKTTTGKYVSERIFKGAQSIKDRTVIKDDHALIGTQAMIAKEIDGLFPSAQATEAVKDATLYIAASFGAEGNGNIKPKDIRRARDLAIGGTVIEHNGKRLPIPAGVDQEAFNSRIKNISPAEVQKQAPDGLVRVGGVLLNVSDFSKSLPGQELMPIGPGRYAVIVQGRPVTNTSGSMVIIKMQ
jgi:hypothetical protein